MLFSISSKLGVDSNGVPVSRNNENPIDEQFHQIDQLEATSHYLGATRLYISVIEKDQSRTETKFMAMLEKSDVNVSLVHNFCVQMQRQGHSGAAILLGFIPVTEDKENTHRHQQSSESKSRSDKMPKHTKPFLSPVQENVIPEITGGYPNHSSFGPMMGNYPNHSSFSHKRT